MNRLSAVIIARDEERNIAECLQALRFCGETVVVDSGSRDRTMEIAATLGARVLVHPFTDFASQKNFAMDKASGDWLLLVDADERVTPELAAEIRRVLAAPQAEGYFLRRKNRLFGRWMRFGPNRNDLQLRLVRRGRARFEGAVHERIRLQGPTAVLKNPLLHFSTASVAEFRRKLDLYTELEARALDARGGRVLALDLFWRPPAVFLRQALWQGGVLDGWAGLKFSALSAYYEWLRRYKHLKYAGAKHKV